MVLSVVKSPGSLSGGRVSNHSSVRVNVSSIHSKSIGCVFLNAVGSVAFFWFAQGVKGWDYLQFLFTKKYVVNIFLYNKVNAVLV
jgi:hypothetical protein